MGCSSAFRLRYEMNCPTRTTSSATTKTSVANAFTWTGMPRCAAPQMKIGNVTSVPALK